jgi:hypothetical protein
VTVIYIYVVMNLVLVFGTNGSPPKTTYIGSFVRSSLGALAMLLIKTRMSAHCRIPLHLMNTDDLQKKAFESSCQ